MTFQNLIEDLHKLVGVTISSVRPGASVTITSISEKEEKLCLKNAQGKSQERSLRELHRIWNAMQKTPAVRVEDVLQGSGSSRNQPETILANLPYVEWAKINNKKHICFVGNPTHHIGTLKQMGAIQVNEIKKFLAKKAEKRVVSLVVVSASINEASSRIASICGSKPDPIAMGVYCFVGFEGIRILLTTPSPALSAGVYPVLYTVTPIMTPSKISIGEFSFVKGTLSGSPVLFLNVPLPM